MKYKAVLEKIFANKLKSGKITFRRALRPEIKVYFWEEECAYIAPFRCLSNTIFNKDAICSRIEMKYPEFVKRSEYYLFCEKLNDFNLEDLVIRKLTYQDDMQVNILRDQCSKEDLDVANINVYEGYVMGAFMQNKLVGVSCCEDFNGILDLSVLIHPLYRSRNIAKALVSAQARRAIEKQGICMYRCDDFNIASLKVAQALGFEKKIEVLFYELEENR